MGLKKLTMGLEEEYGCFPECQVCRVHLQGTEESELCCEGNSVSGQRRQGNSSLNSPFLPDMFLFMDLRQMLSLRSQDWKCFLKR